MKNTWWTLFDTRQHCIICQYDIIYRIYLCDDVYICVSNDSNMFLIFFEAFVLKLKFWGCSSWCSTWIVWWNFKTLGRDGCAAFIGGGTWGQLFVQITACSHRVLSYWYSMVQLIKESCLAGSGLRRFASASLGPLFAHWFMLIHAVCSDATSQFFIVSSVCSKVLGMPWTLMECRAGSAAASAGTVAWLTQLISQGLRHGSLKHGSCRRQ